MQTLATRQFSYKTLCTIAMLFVFTSALLVYIASPFATIALLLFAIVVLFFSQNLVLGLALLIVFTPFVDLQLIWHEYNVPVGDFFAIILFIAWIVSMLKRDIFSSLQNIKAMFPELTFFIAFIILASFSFLNTPDIFVSLKYFARPIIFFYLMFLVLPYAIFTKSLVLRDMLKIAYIVGIAVAFIGFFSLFLREHVAWFRAIPVTLWGVAPLGTNHNLIAEVLVTVIPIGWIFAMQERKTYIKKILTLSNIFLALVCLMTFSRAGWIALALETAIFIFLMRENIVPLLQRMKAWLVIFCSVLVVLMALFTQTFIVASSNSNRSLLNEITLDAFLHNPWIGHGLNTFLDIVAHNTVFIVEFGAPLEAHGFIQKLLVEVGILGTFGFLIFLGRIFYRGFCALKLKNTTTQMFSMHIALLCASCGIVLFEVFNTSYFIGKMWLTLGLCVASAHLMEKQSKTLSAKLQGKIQSRETISTNSQVIPRRKTI